MTPLTKPVRRVTLLRVDRSRQAVVSLEPGDLITIRLKGTRTTEVIPIGAVYDLAVKIRVRAEKAERLAKKKAKAGVWK